MKRYVFLGAVLTALIFVSSASAVVGTTKTVAGTGGQCSVTASEPYWGNYGDVLFQTANSCAGSAGRVGKEIIDCGQYLTFAGWANMPYSNCSTLSGENYGNPYGQITDLPAHSGWQYRTVGYAEDCLPGYSCYFSIGNATQAISPTLVYP